MKTISFVIALFLSISVFAQPSKRQKNTAPKMEVFATVDGAVGNIAFTHSGDAVYSYHPFFEPTIRVAKYNATTKKSEPFPNLEWNTPRPTDDHYFSNVLGIRNDENGIIWVLDMGHRNPITPKVVGWNTHKNQLERIYYLPQPTATKFTQPNDMLIDTKNQVIIIADEGIANDGDGSTASLLVVDMKTGRTRRVLEGTHSTLPENVPIVVDGKELKTNGKRLLIGCDAITADKNFEWLYYAPLNGNKMYRLKISDLLNENLSEKELDQRVETYSEKPNNGGMSIDEAGNLYLTSVENRNVTIIYAKDRSVKTFAYDERLLWADGVSYNHADGYMYVSAAQVHLGAIFNNGKNLAKPPYYIFRFKPEVKGVDFR